MTRRELVEALEESAKRYPAYEASDLPVFAQFSGDKVDAPTDGEWLLNIEWVHVEPDRVVLEIEWK